MVSRSADASKTMESLLALVKRASSLAAHQRHLKMPIASADIAWVSLYTGFLIWLDYLSSGRKLGCDVSCSL